VAHHSAGVCAVVPAHNEEARIKDTLLGLLAIPEVGRILVVDDGSTDTTVLRAARVRHPRVGIIQRPRNEGKGAALNEGVRRAGSDWDVMVFVDADLGSSSIEMGKVVLPVLRGEADMTLATFPRGRPGGGFGLTVGLARWANARLTGSSLHAPLSGQRAFTRPVWEKAGPCASGYAADAILTLKALRAGFRVKEVETVMTHRVTGMSFRDIYHRSRQFWHLILGLLRLVGNL